MKKIIFIYTIVLFVGKIVLLSQNCGVQLNCDPTKKYPYIGCEERRSAFPTKI